MLFFLLVVLYVNTYKKGTKGETGSLAHSMGPKRTRNGDLDDFEPVPMPRHHHTHSHVRYHVRSRKATDSDKEVALSTSHRSRTSRSLTA